MRKFLLLAALMACDRAVAFRPDSASPARGADLHAVDARLDGRPEGAEIRSAVPSSSDREGIAVAPSLPPSVDGEAPIADAPSGGASGAMAPQGPQDAAPDNGVVSSVASGASAASGASVANAAPNIVASAIASTSASGASQGRATYPMRQKDWSIENGRWTFDDDGVATCDCKSTSAHLYYRPLQPRDFDVSVEVQFHGRESSAGILFREQGADFWRDATFYQFEWYTVGSHHNRRLSLMTKNPYWVQIVEPKYPEAPYGRWLRFRVRAEGPRLRCFLDNELVFEKFDNAMVRSGRIGLHVFQPRPVSFRNFQLRALKGSEASVPQ